MALLFLSSIFSLLIETDCSIPRCDGMLYAWVQLFLSLTNV